MSVFLGTGELEAKRKAEAEAAAAVEEVTEVAAVTASRIDIFIKECYSKHRCEKQRRQFETILT